MSDVRVPEGEQLLTGLRLAQRKQGEGPPTAGCRHCKNEPLVTSLHWRKAEFVCLSCGRLYGFLDPLALESTPEILALSKARDAQWEELSHGLLTPGAWQQGCGLCDHGRGTSHMDHAELSELITHHEARARVELALGRSA